MGLRCLRSKHVLLDIELCRCKAESCSRPSWRTTWTLKCGWEHWTLTLHIPLSSTTWTQCRWETCSLGDCHELHIPLNLECNLPSHHLAVAITSFDNCHNRHNFHDCLNLTSSDSCQNRACQKWTHSPRSPLWSWGKKDKGYHHCWYILWYDTYCWSVFKPLFKMF